MVPDRDDALVSCYSCTSLLYKCNLPQHRWPLACRAQRPYSASTVPTAFCDFASSLLLADLRAYFRLTCSLRLMQASCTMGDLDSLQALPQGLVPRVLQHLPRNEVVINGRLVNKDALDFLDRPSEPEARIVRFSVPLPPNAAKVGWREIPQYFLRTRLTTTQRFSVVSVAACSGCFTNLEVAWRLAGAGLFPGLLSRARCMGPRQYYTQRGTWLQGPDPPKEEDPGAAAVASGNLGALEWLLDHLVPLEVDSTLEVAAEHCSIDGLQRVWELLHFDARDNWRGRDEKEALSRVAMAAGRSSDAIGKIQWLKSKLRNKAHDRNGALTAAAKGAAAAGSLPALSWLRGLDPALYGADGAFKRKVDGRTADCHVALALALEHGHVAVGDWLVDVLGCPLQQHQGGDQQQEYHDQQQQQQYYQPAWGGEGEGEEEEDNSWQLLPSPPPQQDLSPGLKHVWEGAARGGDRGAVEWLLGRGVPLHQAALEAAAGAGQLRLVQFLHTEHGLPLTEEVFAAAAGSRSLPTVQWLLQAGCPVSRQAYRNAALAGDTAMVRWLVCAAQCPVGDGIGTAVVHCQPGSSSSEDLVAAVQALVAAGCEANEVLGIDSAAVSGHASLVRFLHDECGVPFEPCTLAFGAAGGCFQVIEYLVSAGCRTPTEWGVLQPYDEVLRTADLTTLTYLRMLNVPWDDPKYIEFWVYDMAERPIKEWLVREGAYTAEQLWYVEEEGPAAQGQEEQENEEEVSEDDKSAEDGDKRGGEAGGGVEGEEGGKGGEAGSGVEGEEGGKGGALFGAGGVWAVRKFGAGPGAEGRAGEGAREQGRRRSFRRSRDSRSSSWPSSRVAEFPCCSRLGRARRWGRGAWWLVLCRKQQCRGVGLQVRAGQCVGKEDTVPCGPI